MNNRTNSPDINQSPWLEHTKPNLFRHEFQLARENLPGEYFTPLEPYRWIFQNNGESLFFKGLARLAPMFALHAYHGQVAVWTSPPPSGLGNAIYIVMGHDAKGVLRLVGGNYFKDPRSESGPCLDSASFFGEYDDADQRSRQDLVRDAIQADLMPEDVALIYDIRAECEHVHTMAVYIRVLTDEGSLFHAAKALIEGEKPADFSYEFFGEIK